MKTVFKYKLKVDDYIKIKMPIGAEILTVQAQGGNPCIWALVDTTSETKERSFEIYGTGHEMGKLQDTEARNYIGTFQLYNGDLVFHLFEVVPSRLGKLLANKNPE